MQLLGIHRLLIQQVSNINAGSENLPAQVPCSAPYGTDGDYFSKPSVEDMVEAAYGIMHEADPGRFEEVI